MLIPWSLGARTALSALRQAQDADGYISVAAALIAWIDAPGPGVSAIHAALHGGQQWAQLYQYRLLLRGDAAAMRGLTPCSIRSLAIWETEAEDLAHRERVLRVSERHLIDAMADQILREVGVDGPRLKADVREIELGSAGIAADLRAWHHVALDVSALIEYNQPDQIVWEQVIGPPGVVIWVVSTVLNELDETKRHVNRQVADRARARGRWLWQHTPAAISPEGAQIRPRGARLRVWAAASATPFRDTDHLEAISELRALGYELEVVSDDALMAARAAAVGLPARRLDDAMRDPKQTAPVVT